ncbi:MAG: hypothetical protein HGA35_00355 [Erysipelotrichaceae bacterium]|nr:hypothetical protein [Erysipelotrichaceae bacterium]
MIIFIYNMPLISKKRANEIGLPNPSLQTILIPNVYSITWARKWLMDHGFLYQNYRQTKNINRFIQAYDVRGASYYSKKLSNGVVMVFQSW